MDDNKKLAGIVGLIAIALVAVVWMMMGQARQSAAEQNALPNKPPPGFGGVGGGASPPAGAPQSLPGAPSSGGMGAMPSGMTAPR